MPQPHSQPGKAAMLRAMRVRTVIAACVLVLCACGGPAPLAPPGASGGVLFQIWEGEGEPISVHADSLRRQGSGLTELDLQRVLMRAPYAVGAQPTGSGAALSGAEASGRKREVLIIAAEHAAYRRQPPLGIARVVPDEHLLRHGSFAELCSAGSGARLILTSGADKLRVLGSLDGGPISAVASAALFLHDEHMLILDDVRCARLGAPLLGPPRGGVVASGSTASPRWVIILPPPGRPERSAEHRWPRGNRAGPLTPGLHSCLAGLPWPLIPSELTAAPGSATHAPR